MFNQSDTVLALLQCLREQTFKGDIEVLLCDDGSDSEHLMCINNCIKKSDSLDVRLIWQPNLGFRLGRARNNGIRCAQGDIIIFIDGDMVFSPAFIDHHARQHTTAPLMVFGTRRFVYLSVEAIQRLQDLSADEMLSQISGRVVLSDLVNQQVAIRSSAPWAACIGCNLSITRQREAHFNERFVGWGLEDWEFSLRLFKDLGYSLTLSTDLAAYHVAAEPCVRGKLTSHEQIVQFLTNYLELRRTYPGVDLWPVTRAFCSFELDSHSDRWISAMLPNNPLSLAEETSRVEQWFARHGSVASA